MADSLGKNISSSAVSICIDSLPISPPHYRTLTLVVFSGTIGVFVDLPSRIAGIGGTQ